MVSIFTALSLGLIEDGYKSHLWISDSGLSPLDTRHWTHASGLGTWCRLFGLLSSGLWTLDSGLWTLDSRHGSLWDI